MNSSGMPSHNFSSDSSYFIFEILAYFVFLSLALIPYQGNLPFKKYTKVYPIPSKSSLLAYSIPL